MRHGNVRLQVYIPGLNTTYWYFFDHAYWIIEGGTVMSVHRDLQEGVALVYSGRLFSVSAERVVAIYFAEDVTEKDRHNLVFGYPPKPTEPPASA